ncbi:unnamed protein product [Trichobilharzia szidati]|nr:unnamed protein product [Trichobilharzia szidati]
MLLSPKGSCIHCDPKTLKFSEYHWILRCRCHENADESLEWRWCKPESLHQSLRLSENDATVTFHPVISWGTAVVRGTTPLKYGLHYWELKAVSPLYGTDIMIGIGRKCAKLDQYARQFCSALGIDSYTWGLSYRGVLMHADQTSPLGTCAFKRGSIIGCLLDLWHYKLYFYVNGQLDPKACFNNLPRDEYYPMVSSTTLKSGFRLIRAKSYPITLQFLTCYALYQQQYNYSNLTTLNIPSGLWEMLSNTLPYSLLFNRIKQFSIEHNATQQVSCNAASSPADSPDYFLWTSFSSSDTEEHFPSNEIDLYALDIVDQTTQDMNDEPGVSVNEEANDFNAYLNMHISTASQNCQKRRYQAAMSASSVLDRLFTMEAKNIKRTGVSDEMSSSMINNENESNFDNYEHRLWGEFND